MVKGMGFDSRGLGFENRCTPEATWPRGFDELRACPELSPAPGIMPVALDVVASWLLVISASLSCPVSPSTLQVMEVASPTAGSVLVELSQLQLLQECREVAVRTMSAHGESADSIPAPIAPALARACLPARVSCPSPRPGPEARSPLASASPGPADPSSPLRCPAPHGTQDPPGGPPASPSRETPKGTQEEPPAPGSQVPCWGRGTGGGGERGLRLGACLSACHSRRKLGPLCWVPQATGKPASQPWESEFLALQPPPWSRRRLSGPQERPARHPAAPRIHWPRGCPVLRSAAEETRGPG